MSEQQENSPEQKAKQNTKKDIFAQNIEPSNQQQDLYYSKFDTLPITQDSKSNHLTSPSTSNSTSHDKIADRFQQLANRSHSSKQYNRNSQKEIWIEGKYKVIKKRETSDDSIYYEVCDSHNNKAILEFMHRLNEKEQHKTHQRIAQIMALSHGNIQNILDHGMYKSNIFIVRDYIEEKRQLQHITSPPIDISIGIVIQILTALEHLHSYNYVHLSLNPSTIYVCNNNIKIQMVLPKRLRNPVDFHKMNSEYVHAYYIPLEQIQKSKSATSLADIYATGAILFYLLAGRAPFVEIKKTLDRLFYAKLKDHYQRLPEIRSDLPQNIVAVVEKAMGHKLHDRYQSAMEMKEDLQNCLAMDG
ncbi:serine/threonine protein kinase [Candidatus Uabimicrobium amorphum]|uniref:Serine/threonine protein kinase n=1 Tax=Uabimicrobium amorphum TaxID=2596890 RepID=A0A5S9F1M4_UABAM|nr:protein kinase [Candidatus Uabimicrobium amorphum]BBM82351.1 serine/threonine protein kinase [Candidatus Uabimicrobium amorphum]